MKANELMIGDWVELYGTPTRWEIEDYAKWHKEMERTDVHTFEPIPLTAEILEKNGFSETTEAEFNYYQMPDDCFEIHINNVGCAYIVDVIIRYVHQLQHALRLCGIDKEIVL